MNSYHFCNGIKRISCSEMIWNAYQCLFSKVKDAYFLKQIFFLKSINSIHCTLLQNLTLTLQKLFFKVTIYCKWHKLFIAQRVIALISVTLFTDISAITLYYSRSTSSPVRAESRVEYSGVFTTINKLQSGPKWKVYTYQYFPSDVVWRYPGVGLGRVEFFYPDTRVHITRRYPLP